MKKSNKKQSGAKSGNKGKGGETKAFLAQVKRSKFFEITENKKVRK